MTQFGMTIDKKLCIGCHTCSMACKTENNLPVDVWWNTTITDGGDKMDTPRGTFPNVEMAYVTLACQHCANPACVEVCPSGATYKDEETGIVHQDTDVCIGCKACLSACPYEGVRTYVEGDPQYHTETHLGDYASKGYKPNTVGKCTMCQHRLDRDEQPACIMACPMRARVWGDSDDPESAVSKLLERREYEQLLPEENTGPSVYFLV